MKKTNNYFLIFLFVFLSIFSVNVGKVNAVIKQDAETGTSSTQKPIKAVCTYNAKGSVSDFKITVTVSDSEFDVKAPYPNVASYVNNTNLTKKNFMTNDGYYKCLPELWYSFELAGSGRSASAHIYLSYESKELITMVGKKNANRSATLSNTNYTNETSVTPEIKYDYVCQYGKNYLSFNSTDYKIQLEEGYGVSSPRFKKDEITQLKGCPPSMHFFCAATSTGKYCSVGLTKFASSSEIQLVTNQIPGYDDITNPSDGEDKTPDDTKDEDDFSIETISCGQLKDIPKSLPKLTNLFINLIKIIVPIGIVVKSMIDLAKSVIAQKEDEIKKGQSTFVKRLIAGIAVFLVIALSQVLFSIFATAGEANTIADCINCFLNNKC